MDDNKEGGVINLKKLFTNIYNQFEYFFTELKCDLGSQQELAMDRLGQVLHCFTSMNCLQSKPNDICQSLKKLKPQNRLIQMYLQRYN